MDPFSYVSVLLSIILGLAVAQLLTGIRGHMLTRARVRPFWPTQLWAALLLLVAAQTWWAMFGLHNRTEWNFGAFAILLAQGIALYLLTGLVYPDFPHSREIDLEEHYFAQRRHFFTLLIIAALVSICRDLVLQHALPHPANLGFHVVFIGLGVSGLLVVRRWYHKALAVFTALLFTIYIAWLFTELR